MLLTFGVQRLDKWWSRNKTGIVAIISVAVTFSIVIGAFAFVRFGL